MSGVEFLTPAGRLVQGTPWEGRGKDQTGKQLTNQSGQPIVRYFMALAIPKTDPGWAALEQTIRAEGTRGWPQHHNLPTFSWKIVDGDSQVPDAGGKRPCDKEGFAGHWVLKFSSTFAPKCFDQQCQPLTDPQSIKPGYYIRISGSVAANDSQQKPGVYVNPLAVQLVGYGQEIVSGPDGSVFAATPAALPAGASAAPVAPAAAPQTTPPPTPAAPPAPPVPPPAPDFLTPPAPPAAPVVQYSHQGKTYTADALRAAGWTDAQIQTLPTA